MNKKTIISLKSNQLIKEVYRNGMQIKNESFTLKFISNELEQMRFAISVNKKLFRTAVLRNKIKRQIRAIVRSLKMIKSIDVLIIVQINYLKNTFTKNRDLLINLYNKT